MARANIVVLAIAVLAATLVALASVTTADAEATLPSGFEESVVLGGLDQPTSVEFAKDGRVFVAEKSGLIKAYDNLSDQQPTIFADLRTKVHNYWDRGLLGLSLDPNFPAAPYVYALYTRDAPLHESPPRWGAPGATSDPCPTPPGPSADGCMVTGRLSRLQVDLATNTMSGSEKALIEDWCQQYPFHSVGDLAFGSDGKLYVSGGDGAAHFDYGQYGGRLQDSPTPRNPCGDPPTGVGGMQTPPTAEGGALRSQDLRTSGDWVALNGAILRVDPATGDPVPGNPFYGIAGPNASRVIAYGLRNPFRFAIRPGTSEVWIGNVGWNKWEEINRINNPTDAVVENFGWPCYEGTQRQVNYDAANLNICENLYGTPNTVKAPYFSYGHNLPVFSGDACPENGASITGPTFYNGGSYPDQYDGSLIFGDYVRDCIWVMFDETEDRDKLPDPATLKTLVAGASNPVDLELGPGGDLFYVDIGGGTIRRIKYFGGNRPPKAVAKADPTNGPTPLTVSFDGTESSDAEGSGLSYAWDLDGDGGFDDSSSSRPSHTYTTAGNYDVQLRVTDNLGASDELDTPITISPGNTPPTAVMEASPTTWRVGDEITFSGSATDTEDGTLPASSLSWSLIQHHCSTEGSCHEHPVQEFTGVSGGSFVAPDHEYPSHLELRLTARDTGGLSDSKSIQLNPRIVTLTFRTSPAGLELVFGSDGETAPFDRPAIVGSKNLLSAPTPQEVDGQIYRLVSWSDGKAQSHEVIAGGAASTYTATYTMAPKITGVNPRPDSSTKDRTPTIRATVSDAETDLTKDDISLYLDGRWIGRSTFVYDRTTDSLTYTPGSRLALGWHTAKIKAVDSKNITGTKSWRFRIVSG